MPDHWARQRLLWGLRGNCGLSLRALLLCLNYHQGDNAEAWPSQETLSAELSLSDRQVRSLIKDAVRRGWIAVRRSWPNRYSICWDRLRETGTPLPDSPDRNRKPTSGNNRNSTSDLSARNRKPTSDKHPSKNTHKNTQGAAASKKPSMPSIEPDDLRSPERLDALFRQAVAAGLVTDRDRLRWHTLARHISNRNGIHNPGGLMARLVRAGQWDGSDADEGKAQAAIKALDRQQAGPVNGHAQTLAASLRSDFRSRRDHDD